MTAARALFPLTGNVFVLDSLERRFLRIDRCAVLHVSWDDEIVFVHVSGKPDPFKISMGEGWCEPIVRDITTGSGDSVWEYTKDDQWLRNGEVVPAEEGDADGFEDPA